MPVRRRRAQRGGHPIASGRANPVRVAAWWGDQPAPADWTEPVRGTLGGIIEPGATGSAVVPLPPPREPFAPLDLVQEGIAGAHSVPDGICPQVAAPSRRSSR